LTRERFFTSSKLVPTRLLQIASAICFMPHGFFGGAGGALGGVGGAFGGTILPGCPGGGGLLGGLQPQPVHFSLVIRLIFPHFGQAISGTNPQLGQTAAGSLSVPHCGQGSTTNFFAVGGRKHISLISLRRFSYSGFN